MAVEGPSRMSNVLRFSNTVFNRGEGRLEVRSNIDPVTKEGPAIQRIFTDTGTFSEQNVGRFYYHVPHDHWHYDDWGTYQLWRKADYDAWVASGRTEGAAAMIGTKTTSCVMDEEFIDDLPGTPYPARYPSGGCSPNGSGLMTQGLSPGWGDTYDYWRFEQWVDLGQTTLANGQYVLRSVTDPQNKIYESANKADAAREGIVDNEGITVLTVQNGTILDATKPSGTVTINDVDASTASKNVTVKVIGRDDVSGVDQFRLSNDGQTWSSPINYTSTGSTSTSVSWDITNPDLRRDLHRRHEDGVRTVPRPDRQVVRQRVRHDHLQRRRRGRHLRLLQRRARGLSGGLLAAGRGRRHHRRRLGRGQPGHLHQQPAAGRGRAWWPQTPPTRPCASTA